MQAFQSVSLCNMLVFLMWHLLQQVLAKESESGGKVSQLESYEIEGADSKEEVLQNLTEFQFSAVSISQSLLSFIKECHLVFKYFFVMHGWPCCLIISIIISKPDAKQCMNVMSFCSLRWSWAYVVSLNMSAPRNILAFRELGYQFSLKTSSFWSNFNSRNL